LVVDASVAAKWYLPEDLSEEATWFLEAGGRGEARLVAPSLLLPELGNVLWHRHRRGDISSDRLREAWAAFEVAPLSFVEPGPLMPAALEIALVCGCTVYDALYVALAEAHREEGAAVLTADGRLISRLANTAFAGRVKAIGEA
jgi:predicted nucleic acid-binding protein